MTWLNGIFYILLHTSLCSGSLNIGMSRIFALSKKADRKSENAIRLHNLIKMRGGEAEESSAAKKIKGLCIGIDLGTTYRFLHKFHTILTGF